MENLVLAIFILHHLQITAFAASNGSEEPYLLLAINSRIDAVDLNGNSLIQSINDHFRINAIDYHYRTRHVYWISSAGNIKRAHLGGMQNITVVVHDPKAVDLAVDWLEDTLYWTHANSSKIYRVDLNSISFPVTSPDLIQVADASGSSFTDIVLNPMTRTMYVVDIRANNLKEVDYAGKRVRDILSSDRYPSCPTLSFTHEAIVWYEVSSEIHVQGLKNRSLSYLYVLAGGHVEETQYHDEKIYWVQKSPTMGMYCRQWNKTEGEVETIATYRSYNVIYDMAIVDASRQPQSLGNSSLAAPLSSKTSSSEMTVTPTTARQGTEQTASEQGHGIVMSSRAVDMEAAPTGVNRAPVASTSVPETTASVGDSPRRLQSAGHLTTFATSSLARKPTTTPLVTTSSVQAALASSQVQAQGSVSRTELSTSTESLSTHTLKLPTPAKSIYTFTSQLSTAAHSSSQMLSKPVADITLPLSTAPTTSSDVNPPASFFTTFTDVKSSTSFVTTSTDVLTSAVNAPNSISTSADSSTLVVSSTLSSTSTTSTFIDPSPVNNGLSIPTAIVPVAMVGSHDRHVTSQSQSPSSESAGGGVVETSTSGLIPIQPSSMVERGSNASVESGSSQRRKTSTVEAVVITISCLSVAVLIFVGLAILDVVYYFCYERKHGKGSSSGVLGGLWRLLTLPYHCLLCPRFVFRRRRKRRYPYVPRCMDSSDISTYYTDGGQTTTTSLSTDHNGSSTTDHNGSSATDQSGSATDHSGLPAISHGSTYGDQQTDHEADFMIVSSNDGNNSDNDSLSSDVAASLNLDYSNCQGPPPTSAVKQLELETKVALGVVDSEEEFEKDDLSVQ